MRREKESRRGRESLSKNCVVCEKPVKTKEEKENA